MVQHKPMQHCVSKFTASKADQASSRGEGGGGGGGGE